MSYQAAGVRLASVPAAGYGVGPAAENSVARRDPCTLCEIARDAELTMLK
jgi:hypothetical protein